MLGILFYRADELGTYANRLCSETGIWHVVRSSL
jgi:hypothetical protein